MKSHKKVQGDYATSSGTPDAWLGKSVKGIVGTSVNIVLTADSCRTEIYINSGKKELNKAIFDKLEQHKEEIESEMGELIWQRLDDKVTCRIYNERPLSYKHPNDKLTIFEYFVEQTKKMKKVFEKQAINTK